MLKYILSIFVSVISFPLFSQQEMSLENAEKSLQKNNLLLLAEQYNITASRAAVIQARIWELPYVSAEFNAINPQENKTFDVGRSGQKQISVEQLIYLGGKKRNEIDFAKSNVEIAELQFQQLLLNLKYQLYQNFYTIYFNQRKIEVLDKQIERLDTLMRAYQTQTENGNIPLKELVRLQTLLLNFRNDRNLIQKETNIHQQELSLITGVYEAIIPQIDEEATIDKFKVPKLLKDASLEKAYVNNPEYLSASKIIQSQELYLAWQNSMKVPDVTAGLAYDQRGGAFNNQINFTIGIPLAYRNKNKGNIKVAEAELQQSKLNKDYKMQELKSKVELAWTDWLQQKNQLLSVTGAINENLEMVYQGVLSNFRKRNITLLEFTDFMESYNLTVIQMYDIKSKWILSGLNINYITNEPVF